MVSETRGRKKRRKGVAARVLDWHREERRPHKVGTATSRRSSGKETEEMGLRGKWRSIGEAA